MARDEAYREAEQKIEEARRSGATQLALTNMGLTELPESLGQLTQLQMLNLEHNHLKVLPEWLGQLTHLQSLEIRADELTRLPNSIGKLTNLRTLDARSNSLSELPDEFSQLRFLRRLRLGAGRGSANPFDKIPRQVFFLNSLVEFSIDLCRSVS